MDSDFVVGINKSIDAAKGETGQTYPAYLHNTLVTEKLDELAGAISEGGGGASALADLTDVDISGSVQGGKVLKYNAVEEKWGPGDDSGNVQSDWNESDSSSGAYILNKPEIMPNYTIGTPTVLVDTTTVSFSKDGDNDWYISAENPITFTLSTSDIDASIFIIEWDGVEYKLFLKMVQEAKPTRGVTGNGYFDWLYIGNMDPLGYGSTITDISVPFAVTVDYMKNAGEKYLFSYDTSASHTIKISKASFTKTIVDYTLYGDARYCGYPATRIASSKGSVAECGAAKSTGSYSHAEGVATIASGDYSHAEGGASTASGNFSHAEGLQVTASGSYSHAEGGGHVSVGFTTASAVYSHAEGYATIASGAASHAEGAITTASGSYSHASGQRTIASGNTAHTCGTYTIAKNKDQVAFGQANIEDPSEAGADARGNYVEIVGNGTWEKVGNETIITRSNARTLDWQGNETLAGDIIINGNQSVTQALSNISAITVIPGTLSAGQTSITFTDARILDDSIVSCATPAGINPVAMTSTTGSVTFHFASQAADMVVKAVIF